MEVDEKIKKIVTKAYKKAVYHHIQHKYRLGIALIN